MPRIRLKYAGTSGIFKILKARICRCDVRRFKCTFSLTDADTGKQIDAQQTHIHISYDIKGPRPASAFYVSHFSCTSSYCYFSVLHAEILDSGRAMLLD